MKEKIIFQCTRNEKNEIDGKTVTFKNIFKRKKKKKQSKVREEDRYILVLKLLVSFSQARF